ncbi:matrixin family metalloprotease [Alloscardovia venturai]|uniref:Matrixin family metalloprotease n=1 Tax=Alloscardovia venturai TaxID=1769421 RepID=A0ABW2Y995_9BIFI
MKRKTRLSAALIGVIATLSMIAVPAMAVTDHQPFDINKYATDSIVFADDAKAATQANPVYSATEITAQKDSDGKVTGIMKNGQLQKYNASVPYWCQVEPGGVTYDGTNDSTLCYRDTDLFQGQAKSLASGEKLSVISGKPHIIYDDVNVDASVKTFLAAGILQRAIKDWNTLLGSDFILLRSQLNEAQIDSSKDYLNYLMMIPATDDFFWAASGSGGLWLNLEEYSQTSHFTGYDNWTDQAGSFPYGNFAVAYGTDTCESFTGKTCTRVDTKEQAIAKYKEFAQQNWIEVLVHEIGHTLGLDHPEDAIKTTYYTEGSAGCAPGEKYYNNGPLLMQYERSNIAEILDGTQSTSVQYRMIKDVISAGLNSITSGSAKEYLSASRDIKVSVLDESGKTTSHTAPLSSTTQIAHYSQTHNGVKKDSYCGGFHGDSTTYWHAPTLSSVDVPAMDGYEVSVDGGRTWRLAMLRRLHLLTVKIRHGSSRQATQDITLMPKGFSLKKSLK